MLNHRSRLVVLPLALAGLAFSGACGNLLDVKAPDLILEEGLTVPANAQMLVDGAVADFEYAFGMYVVVMGVMAHEMIDASLSSSRWPYDRRNVNSSDGLYASYVYGTLSTARWSADHILDKLQGWTDQEVPERQKLIAKAAAYSGYAHLLLAEGLCSLAIDLSAALTSEEVMRRAVQRFDVAVTAAQAAGATDVLNLARVGRARAHLALGETDAGLADAEAVPAGFVFVATASGDFSRRANQVFLSNGEGPSGGTGLTVGEEYRTVTFNGKPDPRVPVSPFVRMNLDGSERYYQRKYRSVSDPTPIASSEEARLIVAEVRGGQAAVDIINALHSAVGLGPFTGTSEAAIQAQVVEERRRELWLEGQRFFDIRRLDLPLVPAPGTPYRKGGVYGDTRCLPLPDVEADNNPNIG